MGAMIQLAIGADPVELATTGDVRQAVRDLAPRPGPDPLPIHRTLVAGGKIGDGSGTATTCVLNLGHASAGRIWQLLMLAVTGADDHTAVANTFATVYAGDAVTPALPDIVDPGSGVANVPGVRIYQPGTVWVASSADLFVVATGLAAQPITVTARIAEYIETAVSARGI